MPNIKCDDGTGSVYEKDLDELRKELKNGVTNVVVNEFKCQIKFTGMSYCGYVVDEKVVNKISEDSIDYIPHGGFTACWGFDCLHCTDIGFFGQKLFSFDGATFKTEKFVIKELEKITESILRFQKKIYL